jgi:hypothetical protein
MEDEPDQNGGTSGSEGPESLLPYDEWTEAALRQVMVFAVRHVAEHGLPGGHHFYLSFRTDHPGTSIPARLKAQYPQEMTIVLQHQFWDLAVDDEAITVGLSFGGVPATLRIPLASVSGFSDPHVRYGLRFRPDIPPELPGPEPQPAPAETPPAAEPEAGAVVSLDAFRRRPGPKT